jgi:hypothetical protein
MLKEILILAGQFLTQDSQKEINTERVLTILKSEALTCKKCSGYAYPVYGSEKKYWCLQCDSRFTNSRHNIASAMSNIGLATSAAYDRAILVLKSEL